MRVGVLALQGGWAAHLTVLSGAGCQARPVRTAVELAAVDGLVLPGGESTAMLRLMEAEGLAERLGARLDTGLPVLATCAGMILLSRGVEPLQPSLERLDLDVRRNAYGRQLHSDVAPVRLAPVFGEPATVEGVFIRAPRVTRIGDGVDALAWRDDEPVVVRQGAIIAATYHPELTDDDRIHQLFLRLVEEHHAR